MEEKNNTVTGSLRRPRIGLTLMLDTPTLDIHLPRFGMNEAYFTSIRRAGGIPIPLVPGDVEEMALYVSGHGIAPAPYQLDGIVFSGGGDMDGKYFGEETSPLCRDLDPQRDEMEMRLLLTLRETGLPILALCRGFQVLNVAWGGTIHQDIATALPEALEHSYSKPHPRDYIAHGLSLAPQSRLAEIMGVEQCDVNSLHHQAINRLGDELIATGWAPDGIIEGFESSDPERFLFGLQCHPEDIPESRPLQRPFEALVKAAATYSGV
jgi:putative glutamine amidotransferase